MMIDYVSLLYKIAHAIHLAFSNCKFTLFRVLYSIKSCMQFT